MELKIKYQYTYFIKPFLINKNKYEKYLLNLLSNTNCKLKIFERERDLNLYSYFIENVRNYFFPTFALDKNQKRKLQESQNQEKANILSKLHCNIFEYKLKEKPQGKINKTDDGEGIFFNIDKIEIICLDSGICFLSLKTNIENSTQFSDLLNFNYKFKDINSDYTMLKEYNDIKIQTSAFENMTELSTFIDDIIGINTENEDLKNIDLYNKRFFVYTYSCIDQENWSNEEDFKNIENDFIKYTNVLSNNNTLNFNIEDFKKNYDSVKEFKYTKFGFTKQSASLITSSIDINNYTKILFDYENEYLYTLIISLYQRNYLKKIEIGFKNKDDLNNVLKMFYKFTNDLWYPEITNSLTGTMYYNKWKEIFELKDIYNQIKNRYETMYKELNIENDTKTNKTLAIALVVSLLLNVINFIIVAKLL